MSEMVDYEAIYRRMHPKRMPYSAYEPQLELRNLWPRDQAEFKRQIDAALNPDRTL